MIDVTFYFERWYFESLHHTFVFAISCVNLVFDEDTVRLGTSMSYNLTHEFASFI